MEYTQLEPRASLHPPVAVEKKGWKRAVIVLQSLFFLGVWSSMIVISELLTDEPTKMMTKVILYGFYTPLLVAMVSWIVYIISRQFAYYSLDIFSLTNQTELLLDSNRQRGDRWCRAVNRGRMTQTLILLLTTAVTVGGMLHLWEIENYTPDLPLRLPLFQMSLYLSAVPAVGLAISLLSYTLYHCSASVRAGFKRFCPSTPPVTVIQIPTSAAWTAQPKPDPEYLEDGTMVVTL